MTGRGAVGAIVSRQRETVVPLVDESRESALSWSVEPLPLRPREGQMGTESGSTGVPKEGFQTEG